MVYEVVEEKCRKKKGLSRKCRRSENTQPIMIMNQKKIECTFYMANGKEKWTDIDMDRRYSEDTNKERHSTGEIIRGIRRRKCARGGVQRG